VLPLEKLIFCKNNNNDVVVLQKESEMATVGNARQHKKMTVKVRTTKKKIKMPNMRSMFDNNTNVDNVYLASQVNNFYSILNSLRSERY
jgi:hypothetical protein